MGNNKSSGPKSSGPWNTDKISGDRPLYEQKMLNTPIRETPEDGFMQQIPKRWLSVAEVMEYTGLCRSSVIKLGEAAGCVRHFGRRVLYDRLAVDQYLEKRK